MKNIIFENDKITIYKDPEVEMKGILLYIHGGGLFFGNRKDLPDLHIEMFTRAGYMISAVDYPLVPEANIENILVSLEQTINSILRGESFSCDNEYPFFLWGRSAGAYLAMLISLRKNLIRKPSGILSYYGYGFFNSSWYAQPSDYYNKMSKVDETVMNRTVQESFESEGIRVFDSLRYSRYVYARQTGLWFKYFYSGNQQDFMKQYSLQNCFDLGMPVFACHSIHDPDVPWEEFQELMKRFHPSKEIAVSNMHDFDRDEKGIFTRKVLDSSITFLEKCLL